METLVEIEETELNKLIELGVVTASRAEHGGTLYLKFSQRLIARLEELEKSMDELNVEVAQL